jgi:hypothetical protein
VLQFPDKEIVLGVEYRDRLCVDLATRTQKRTAMNLTRDCCVAPGPSATFKSHLLFQSEQLIVHVISILGGQVEEGRRI